MWELAIRALEQDATPCQGIEVGRFGDWITVASKVVVEVIGHEQQNIRPRRGDGPAAKNAKQGEEKKAQRIHGKEV